MIPKILFLDIETLPLESYTWGTFDQNVSLDQIKTEWSILSYAAKYKDEKRIYYNSTGGHGRGNVRRDNKLLRELWTLLDSADIVVAQNGKRFDIKKINARMLMAGIRPYSPVRVVDTMLAARAAAAFTSNKLAWLSQYLTDSPKSQHKLFPGFELWLECMADNPKAFKELKLYNIQDIVSLEKLYIRLLPWIQGHPNMGVYSEVACCPNCGSKNVQRRGYAVLQQGKYHRIHCQDCGKWSREKQMLIPLNTRRAILAN